MSTRVLALPNGSPLSAHVQRAVQAVAIPHAVQFVRRDRDGREGGGRLGLEEAEALAEFVRDQVAQRDVVGTA